MTINQTQEKDKITLVLEGKLDTITAPQFDEVLSPALENAKEIVLDFSKLEYISSAGLRVLLLAQRTVKLKNTSMVLKGVSEGVMNTFNMTGFAEVLTIV